MDKKTRQSHSRGEDRVAEGQFPLGEQDYFTIAELAQEFDVSLRTLRFYESKGLLSPKRQGLNRIYSGKDRNRLSAILKGKQLGFTLSEISAMLKDERRDKTTPAQLKMSAEKIDEQIKYLEAQKADVEDALTKLYDYRRGAA